MKSTFARWFHVSIGASAALGMAGCWDSDVRPDPVLPTPSSQQQHNEETQQMPALELQEREGWRVGTDDEDLPWWWASETDVEGGERWRALEPNLSALLAPTNVAHAPFYVPTLFQSLVAPNADDLRAIVTPIDTEAMRTAEKRADGVRSLLAQAAWPKDLAVIVDLPGPQSVALAATLADRLDPIFTFGNWPHPHGVVPAHETLAASLFYAPVFERVKAQRPVDAPPLFVLDGARLAPYSDEPGVFDNRYAARLPTLAALKSLGITHVLYVNADGRDELDDLNEAFIGMRQNGIDVGMLAVDDFSQSMTVPTTDELVDAPDGSWSSDGEGFWYWAGSADSQLGFWSTMGWPYGCRHRPNAGSLHGMRGHGMSPAQHYLPAARGTIFGASSLGQWHSPGRPRGIGQIAVLTSRSTGHVIGMANSRSGSFGRGGGSHGG